jgi:hypothetical protein
MTEPKNAHSRDVIAFSVKRHMQDRWRTLVQTLATNDAEFSRCFTLPTELVMMQLVGFALDLLKLPRSQARRYLDHMKTRQEGNLLTGDDAEFRAMIIKLIGQEHAKVKEPVYN